MYYQMCLHLQIRVWLGYCDSNTGMSESESDALPLGDTPIYIYYITKTITFASIYQKLYKKLKICYSQSAFSDNYIILFS